MTRFSLIKKLSLRNKVVWVLLTAFIFLASSLPRTYQAQVPGERVMEREDNDDRAQRIPFPSVVHGNNAGDLTPVFAVFDIDIPPIISPLTGDVVGTPRQTQIIVFVNAFDDTTDLYSIRLTQDMAVSINLAEAGGFKQISGDALGAIVPLPIGPLVTPTDLDLLLFTSSGEFIDGSFNGPGFIVCTGGGVAGPGPCPFTSTPETILSSTLPRGIYIVNADDFNKFTLFLVGFFPIFPDQNILTNDLVHAWESSSDDPYMLRIAPFGISQNINPDSVEPVGDVKFDYHYTPTHQVRGAADDYYIFKVLTPGNYTFNIGTASSKSRESGRLFLLRLNEAGRRWEPVGQSTIVHNRFESLANVRLESGRYMLAVLKDGIKPFKGKFNYAITVLDELGQPLTMQVNRALPSIEQIREKIQAALDLATENKGGSGK